MPEQLEWYALADGDGGVRAYVLLFGRRPGGGGGAGRDGVKAGKDIWVQGDKKNTVDLKVTTGFKQRLATYGYTLNTTLCCVVYP